MKTILITDTYLCGPSATTNNITEHSMAALHITSDGPILHIIYIRITAAVAADSILTSHEI